MHGRGAARQYGTTYVVVHVKPASTRTHTTAAAIAGRHYCATALPLACAAATAAAAAATRADTLAAVAFAPATLASAGTAWQGSGALEWLQAAACS
jgi:hypothetical protein